MKKFYTIASALMLAMSMTVMTACSSENDPVIDEPVVPEQPTTRIVTLKATADMSAESRVAVEGVEGKEDAFHITGWKDDDVVKVLALKEDGSGAYNEISFTYNASTETFTGTVPPEFDLSELKYAYVGGSFRDAMPNPFTKEWDIIRIRTSIAISDPEDCFLFGNVSVDGESISANLSAPYALACVHNNTSADIEVGQIRNTNDYFWGGLSYRYESTASSFKFGSGSPADASMAEKYTVPAGQKAYFVIPPKDEEGDIYYGLYDFTNEKVIAAPKENITLGKVYKVQVNSAPTTGTAKATIGGSEVDVNWVQLWEDGPKFAEYNVGVTDGKAESFGGYYCWGSSIDQDPNYAYNTGTDDLTGSNDTATNLWGNNWRMPTNDEFEDLRDNCDKEWTTVNGIIGMKFTGRGDYASNSIFLPAAGYRAWPSGLLGDNYFGCYWGSTLFENGTPSNMSLSSGSIYFYTGDRDQGNSVRAVLAEEYGPNVTWDNALTLGKSEATSIVLEVGVATKPAGAQNLNSGGTLWEVLDGTTLRIQSSQGKIIALYNPYEKGGLFQGYSKAETITGLDNLVTEDMTTMARMFFNCKALTGLNLATFNTAKVEDMWQMFYGCEKLTSLDLSTFNIRKVDDVSYMFSDCKTLTSLTVGSDFVLPAATATSHSQSDGMFLLNPDGDKNNYQGMCTIYGATEEVKTSLKRLFYTELYYVKFDGE